MKQRTERKNPYATNRGGKINAPTSPLVNEPKAIVKRGDDLRAK